jgi:hypothetical protein
MTELDRANFILVIRGAWIFDRELDVSRLHDSLAEVLSFYPHLAGRMVAGSAVTLGNAGVPFSVSSRPSVCVRDLCGCPELTHRFADRLHPLLLQRGRGPVLAVRLTRLRDGTLLTVSCSHAVLDGTAFYTFVRNWSRICTGRPFPTPVLDPTLVPAPTAGPRDEILRRAAAEGWTPVSPWTLARMALLSTLGRLGGRRKMAHLAPQALRRLRNVTRREAARPRLRTFEALSAELTRLCARLVELPEETPCSQVTVLDARGHVASLPVTYVGNAAFTVACTGFAAGASRGEIAARIHDALDSRLAFPSAELASDLSLARAVVSHRALVTPYAVAAMHAPRPTLTYINNFWALPIYDIDFGGEGDPITPLLAVPHDLPDPVLIWPAPPSQGGLDVYFAGTYARAARRLSANAPWWAELAALESGEPLTPAG